MTKTILAGVMASVLMLGSASAFAQTAGQDMKDAGHETKQAAKDTGNGIKKGTKKGYHKTKHGVKKAYHKTGEGAEKLGDKMQGKPDSH